MESEVWDLRIHDVFCLNCNGDQMKYYGYEKGSNLDEGNIINSEKYETDDHESHLFLNFKCDNCNRKVSVMTH